MPITIDALPSGVRFGYRERRSEPQPVIITLAGSVEDSLAPPYSTPADLLPDALQVAVDLPAHGEDVRQGESDGLSSWRARIFAGEDPILQCTSAIVQLIGLVVDRGWADPDRIAFVGYSRGGFMALHAAKRLTRASVVAMLPVTDLAALIEFDGAQQWPYIIASKLTVLHVVNEPMYVLAANIDQRVDSQRTVELWRTTVAWNPNTRMELHMTPTSGHAVPATAYPVVATWLRRLWELPNGGH